MTGARSKRRRGTLVQEVRARLLGALAWIAGGCPRVR